MTILVKLYYKWSSGVFKQVHYCFIVILFWILYLDYFYLYASLFFRVFSYLAKTHWQGLDSIFDPNSINNKNHKPISAAAAL